MCLRRHIMTLEYIVQHIVLLALLICPRKVLQYVGNQELQSIMEFASLVTVLPLY